MRPVTHVADAEVKSAVVNDAPPGARVATGSSRRTVPSAVVTRNVTTMYWAGCRSTSP